MKAEAAASYASLPEALRPEPLTAGTVTAASLDDALARVRLPPPAFCIGGAELHALALQTSAPE